MRDQIGLGPDLVDGLAVELHIGLQRAELADIRHLAELRKSARVEKGAKLSELVVLIEIQANAEFLRFLFGLRDSLLDRSALLHL